MRILIVDDSPIARMILKKILPKDINLDIEEAEGWKDAQDLFREFKPQLTFLDLTMPEKNGLEVLEEFLKISPDARVVVVSADRQKQVIAQCMELGCLAFLPKPPIAEKIREIIEMIGEMDREFHG